MSFNHTHYASEHPRVLVPRDVFERLALGADQQSKPGATVRRRDLAEAAIKQYLAAARAARAQEAPYVTPLITVKAKDPAIRISAALRNQLAEEARLQSAELGRDVAVSHLAVVALTRYLDALQVPNPATTPS